MKTEETIVKIVQPEGPGHDIGHIRCLSAVPLDLQQIILDIAAEEAQSQD